MNVTSADESEARWQKTPVLTVQKIYVLSAPTPAATPADDKSKAKGKDKSSAKKVETKKVEAKKVEAKLSNPGFMAKADDEVIEEHKERRDEALARMPQVYGATTQSPGLAPEALRVLEQGDVERAELRHRPAERVGHHRGDRQQAQDAEHQHVVRRGVARPRIVRSTGMGQRYRFSKYGANR